jgi:integrase
MSDEDIKALRRQAEAFSETIRKLMGTDETQSFATFAAHYLALKNDRPHIRESTKRAFAIQVINHLIPAFGALPIDKVTNAEWLRWVMKKRNTPKPKMTRFFNPRKALAEIMIAAKEEGHLQKAPKFDNPDEAHNVGRCLEDKEIYQIIWMTRRPFRIIFYMLFKMGIRPREMLQWKWEMIRFNEPGHTWIDIPARISKTDRQRSIPINPEVSRILHLRFMRGNGSVFVFPHTERKDKPQLSYNSAWKTACKKAKVKAVPYDLRRTFITRCAAEGKPLIYVAKALDTSTKMIENIYAKSQVEVMESIIK